MSSQHSPTTALALALLQLNVEGLTIAKINILEQLASMNNVTVITLQETHHKNKNILRVPGYTLAGHTANKQHGIATFVLKAKTWSHAHSTLHDGTAPPAPDLAFVKCHNNQSLPVRRILNMFPHRRPSLITIPLLVQPVQGRDVKRWNFRTANYACFTKKLGKTAAGLPHLCPNNLNDAYDSYCKMLLAAAKNNIPHGVRKAYIPCWDDKCEHLLRAHSEAQTTVDRDKAADNLFCGLNDKHRQRWTETVESINFLHSSRRGWQTLNKLTGRSTTPAQYPITAQCPITANSILLSNGYFPNTDKDFNRKSPGTA
ncbi:hypothetical protein D9C73_020315 [Collichthys lucidus]|uniref:Uncharacterized protein n=1 Tax=Collichthys lucidus TaxID=240159 RepID=A0A4U5VDX8_COLLU|nr:hypothetical protein D9C73_020315 [Collichthys lucidus]